MTLIHRFMRFSSFGCSLLAASLALTCPGQDAAPDARTVLDQSGVKGGFVVHVGARDGRFTAALRGSESYLVHGLVREAGQVKVAREAIAAAGGYGPVSADAWDGAHLPYVEGTVNLLVIDQGESVPDAEIERVLTPLGVAMTKTTDGWKRHQKPWPESMDEWTHYYYDAKGNAASKDSEVGPPERLQWLGSPRWSRHHDRMASMSAKVSAKGRLFYIMDEGSRISILLPSKFHLIARDAFNGTVLWKKPIDEWSTNLWPLKTGPTSLTRRLVADGERIFVTMGITAPVSVIEAATGKELRVLPETKGTEELMYADGILYALVNPSAEWVLKDFAPQQQSDQKRVETEYTWDQKPRVLMALNPDSGEILWKLEGLVAPLTPSVDGRRLAYYDGEKIHCLDAKTGQEMWVSQEAPRRQLYEYNFGPRLLFSGETVLFAGGDGSMRGLDAPTGKVLWEAPHEKSGYRSPEDLIVSGGLVWNAGTLQGNQSGEFIGRDLRTGEVKKQFLPDVPPDTYWFHHRCYIAKATDKFLIPSRTGIEYVDHEHEHWDLNHWVRGACLYGVLPCNGLTYAGPHNCACYPEAKLFGMNALAPKAKHPLPPNLPEEARLEKGPAFDMADEENHPLDWPTYRHDAQRSGFSDQDLAADLPVAWETKLGGRLSAPVVANGRVFVSSVETHTLHAIDGASGEEAWHFIAGSRIDSPPTWYAGRVIFGCMDGSVYALRASDGALCWRFRATPTDLRHMAFEQLESVWPVHGSVLVEDGVASFVCGRSCFLDGGMKFFRLDAKTGKKLVEVAFTDRDPETGKPLDELHKTLQMPTALSDILSSDGRGTIYLRSQKIDHQGQRVDIAPVSGNAIEQGAAQRGDHPHLFAAFGYLDAEWFHRALWIYGENSAGGHNGYYQPGKYTPTGRILVFDDENVYSYGREAKYLKWTTTMEHTLQASSKVPPKVDVAVVAAAAAAGKGGARPPGVTFPDANSLDPTDKALTVECWILPDGKEGILINHGAGLMGYALSLQAGKPVFHVRDAATKTLATVVAPEALGDGWHHLAAVLGTDLAMTLYVDGEAVAKGTAKGFPGRPKAPLSFGGGVDQWVGPDQPTPYRGMLDQVVIHHRPLDGQAVLERFARPEVSPSSETALLCTFDRGDARDESGNGTHGVSTAVESGKGRAGAALWFRAVSPVAQSNGKGKAKGKGKGGEKGKAVAKGGAAPKTPDSHVQHQWETYVPVVTRAMALAGKDLFVAGPPDVLDEEYAFEALSQKDPAIQEQLSEQDAALEGNRGAVLMRMDVKTGEPGERLELDSPPVWDGMVVARGHLYVVTVDGRVKRFGK
ncbi:MAG: PQQ-binding-like beta-propeller repeat protein [Verrucomicrobiales bacterium]|nr:PQQ-binding-like beta-propeller repeat protein [Verrucomicrobiales bacterium]